MLNLDGRNWSKKGRRADSSSYRRASGSRRGSKSSFLSHLGLSVVPDRRTAYVLVGLLSAVTVLGGLLLILEPEGFGDAQGRVGIISAQRVDGVDGVGVDDANELFKISGRIDPRKWKAIVIRDTGRGAGNASQIDASHKRLGLGGLGYHFVITNGNGGDDGELEIGYRWDMQFSGNHTRGKQASWYNEHAIGICLVADGDRQGPTQAQLDRLVNVVRQLQERFNIPRQYVRVNFGVQSGKYGSRLFPTADFTRRIR